MNFVFVEDETEKVNQKGDWKIFDTTLYGSLFWADHCNNQPNNIKQILFPTFIEDRGWLKKFPSL